MADAIRPDYSKLAHARLWCVCEMLAWAMRDLDREGLSATANEVERLRADLASVTNSLNPDRSLTALRI